MGLSLFCICTLAGEDSVHSEAEPGLCLCDWVGSAPFCVFWGRAFKILHSGLFAKCLPISVV